MRGATTSFIRDATNVVSPSGRAEKRNVFDRYAVNNVGLSAPGLKHNKICRKKGLACKTETFCCRWRNFSIFSVLKVTIEVWKYLGVMQSLWRWFCKSEASREIASRSRRTKNQTCKRLKIRFPRQSLAQAQTLFSPAFPGRVPPSRLPSGFCGILNIDPFKLLIAERNCESGVLSRNTVELSQWRFKAGPWDLSLVFGNFVNTYPGWQCSNLLFVPVF